MELKALVIYLFPENCEMERFEETKVGLRSVSISFIKFIKFSCLFIFTISRRCRFEKL